MSGCAHQLMSRTFHDGPATHSPSPGRRRFAATRSPFWMVVVQNFVFVTIFNNMVLFQGHKDKSPHLFRLCVTIGISFVFVNNVRMSGNDLYDALEPVYFLLYN